MAGCWETFYRKQLPDNRLKALVDRELENLRVGVEIARLREDEKLSQMKLAAMAGMSGSKISVLENRPKNLRIGTLVRLAHAANRRLVIRFACRKKRQRM